MQLLSIPCQNCKGIVACCKSLTHLTHMIKGRFWCLMCQMCQIFSIWHIWLIRCKCFYELFSPNKMCILPQQRYGSFSPGTVCVLSPNKNIGQSPFSLNGLPGLSFSSYIYLQFTHFSFLHRSNQIQTTLSLQNENQYTNFPLSTSTVQ